MNFLFGFLIGMWVSVLFMNIIPAIMRILLEVN